MAQTDYPVSAVQSADQDLSAVQQCLADCCSTDYDFAAQHLVQDYNMDCLSAAAVEYNIHYPEAANMAVSASDLQTD